MIHLISRSDHIAVFGPPFALGVLALPPNCPPTRAPTAHLDTPSAGPGTRRGRLSAGAKQSNIYGSLGLTAVFAKSRHHVHDSAAAAALHKVGPPEQLFLMP